MANLTEKKSCGEGVSGSEPTVLALKYAKTTPASHQMADMPPNQPGDPHVCEVCFKVCSGCLYISSVKKARLQS